MQTIFKSTYTLFFGVAALLLFLFRGIYQTYAYTDGYDFLWSCSGEGFIKIFIQQGRAISGWFITLIYPHIEHISDLYKVRLINLFCLFISSGIIYKMLKRNNIDTFSAIAIVLLFICSPYASIVVQWEATSSAIWGYPFALLSGEIIFRAYCNKEIISKKRFDITIYAGIILALIALFIYQPSYTAFILPAFLHFITGQDRKIIWRFLMLHIFLYGVYFLLFKLQLNQLNFPPNQRAGVVINPLKILLFLKGVFIRSLHYNIIFSSIVVQIIIILFSLLLTSYMVYIKIKDVEKKDKWKFIGILFMFYLLAYFPNLISADNFIAYRTMGTVVFISTYILISSIILLPVKQLYSAGLIVIIIIVSIAVANYNNNIFVGVASKEYAAVKSVVAEKLKQIFPKNILVIRAEENFLIEQNFVSDVITDEFGKLSNTVYWVPKPFVHHGIYDIIKDKKKAQTINVVDYKRSELPADSIIQKNDWVLDIEKIYKESTIQNP